MTWPSILASVSFCALKYMKRCNLTNFVSDSQRVSSTSAAASRLTLVVRKTAPTSVRSWRDAFATSRLCPLPVTTLWRSSTFPPILAITDLSALTTACSCWLAAAVFLLLLSPVSRNLQGLWWSSFHSYLVYLLSVHFSSLFSQNYRSYCRSLLPHCVRLHDCPGVPWDRLPGGHRQR